jgi:hypothetical protein
MKKFQWSLPVLMIAFWGCTPAQFGYNATDVAALSETPNGNSSNPTLPGSNGGDEEEQVGDGEDGKPNPKPTPTYPGGGDGGSNDGGKKPPGDGCKDHNHGKPEYLPPDNPQVPGNYSCGKSNGKKVMICHVPGGDYAKSHTLCVAVQGAVNGHGVAVGNLQPKSRSNGMHLKDYIGACGQRPPNQEN